MEKAIHLKVDQGVAAGKLLSIPAAGATLGRSATCDIPCNDAQLSRHHCRFFFRADKLWVKDLDSSNGTLVNGQPIQETRLCAGDRVAVGDTVLVVIRDDSRPQLKVRTGGRDASAESMASPRRAGERLGRLARAAAWLLLLAWLLFLAYSLVERDQAPVQPDADSDAQITTRESPSSTPPSTPPKAASARPTGLASTGALARTETRAAAGPPPPSKQPDLLFATPSADELAANLRQLKKTVATHLAQEQYDLALARLRQEALKFEPGPIRDRIEQVEKVVHGAAASTKSIENSLMMMTGKEVSIFYGGRQATLVPKALVNGKIVFSFATPSGTEVVKLGLSELSIADRLRFLGTPDSVEKSILRCSLLLRAGRRAEARTSAAGCGPLADVFSELASGG